MVFELNKFYKHTGGGMMHMISIAEAPIMWMGPTLIAEDASGFLTPCGMDETSADNWVEIERREFMAPFTEGG